MKNLIRWHLPLGSEDRSRMHQAFCYSYLMTTLRKKRSLQEHMKAIGFEIILYAEKSFDTLLGEFLPLYAVTDFLLMYLVEGVKVIFRYSYAVLKIHKNFIKTVCFDASSFLDLLAAESRCKT